MLKSNGVLDRILSCTWYSYVFFPFAFPLNVKGIEAALCMTSDVDHVFTYHVPRIRSHELLLVLFLFIRRSVPTIMISFYTKLLPCDSALDHRGL